MSNDNTVIGEETMENEEILEVEEITEGEEKKPEKVKKTKRVKRILARIGISVATVLVVVLLFLVGVVFVLEKGPSRTATELFVNSAMETSAGKFLARVFISAEELEEILNANSIKSSDEVTDSTLIDFEEDDTDDRFIDEDGDGLVILDIVGSTYNGKMLIVKDPSRVTVGMSGTYGADQKGKPVNQIAQKYQAVAAVNGGGFVDIGGQGWGGEPIGLVISGSKLMWGSLQETYEVIGIDKNNTLVVGKMTAQEALDRGVRDAISFGPILIVNGKPADVSGNGSGLNPRSVIGQRKDGSIILLVLNGRQINSIGATYGDLIDIMQEYGAVNAANLDGGSSSIMYYKGEYITTSCSIYGPRYLPTTIIVK